MKMRPTNMSSLFSIVSRRPALKRCRCAPNRQRGKNMNRLEKKCLIASTGTHLFLFLLLVFGSAFFVSRDKTMSLRPLTAVPTRLVDDALSGGGGNPNIAPSDAQQKGQTLVPQPRVDPQPVLK